VPPPNLVEFFEIGLTVIFHTRNTADRLDLVSLDDRLAHLCLRSIFVGQGQHAIRTGYRRWSMP